MSNAKIITAKASQVLVTPRKANLVLEAIVGTPASLALKQLAILHKKAADPIAKLIKQGIGNAVSQHNVSPDSLLIDSAFATKARTLKRAHIGGRGRTKPYERVACHMTINLRVKGSEVLPKASPKKEVKQVEAPKEVIKETPKKVKAVSAKPKKEVKKDTK